MAWPSLTLIGPHVRHVRPQWRYPRFLLLPTFRWCETNGTTKRTITKVNIRNVRSWINVWIQLNFVRMQAKYLKCFKTKVSQHNWHRDWHQRNVIKPLHLSVLPGVRDVCVMQFVRLRNNCGRIEGSQLRRSTNFFWQPSIASPDLLQVYSVGISALKKIITSAGA